MNTSLAPLPDQLATNWWTGAPAVDPARFTIDCSQYAMDESDFKAGSELGRRMNEIFDEIGLVYLINTGLTDVQKMRAAARLVMTDEMKYEAGANPRDRIEPNVYEIGAPLVAHLHYHHEMAYVGESSTMLGFMAKTAIDDRGATFVSDNVAATDAILATDFGQKLKELGICYHRDLTDRERYTGKEPINVYNHWQKSMLTEDPDEAETVAREKGLEIEWGPNRMLRTRYYISAFEYYEPLDRNLLFASIADDGAWFDTWPMVQHIPYDQRPLKLTFGDLTEMTRAEKQLFIDVYDQQGVPINWSVGDVALVCNWRWAHGRPGIHLNPGESRELGVMLGANFKRVGDLPDKW
ncbi:MAG: TauD/TfdA family dioxygenase [Pseudomonadota bacterium]